MSGGHFNYNQYKIQQIADELEQIILNAQKDDAKDWEKFSPETLNEFRKGLYILRQAYVYAQRIDWLVSADDGEDSFHRRLQSELSKISQWSC